MLNPIPLIQKIYQLDKNPQQNGLDQAFIEQHEADLGVQYPAPLYHYLHELGNATIVNESYHQFIQLPFERLDEYLVIGQTCDDDGVWGIHQDDLKQSNPMVRMSRNFDALEQSEVHWFDELPLAEFLLAMAITNGVNGGLTHHAQIYDFENDIMPKNLIEKVETFAQDITELHQPHERYFQADDYQVLIMIGLDEKKANAFLLGSQDEAVFEAWIKKLTTA